VNIENQVKCAVCGWDKLCLRPPRTTEAEAARRTDELVAKAKAEGKDPLVIGLMSTVMMSGDIGTCPACPVFIERIQAGPKLSNMVRKIMKEWEDD